MNDSRKFKTGETVVIKQTKVKAVIEDCFYNGSFWIYSLKGWPAKISEDLLETFNQPNNLKK